MRFEQPREALVEIQDERNREIFAELLRAERAGELYEVEWKAAMPSDEEGEG